MKSIYINYCQYNFVDNVGNILFSFKKETPITPLDIRKLQLASMIKGEWCNTTKEIDFGLYTLNHLSNYDIGNIVKHFKLFDTNCKSPVSFLPDNCWRAIISIKIYFESNPKSFLIEKIENK